MKSTKGITLIALVITIIVLLILAGVAIATLTGNNGILTQSQKAKYVNIYKGAEEQVNLATMAVKAEIAGQKAKSGTYSATDAESINALKAIVATDLVSEGSGFEVEDPKDGTVTGTKLIRIRYSNTALKASGISDGVPAQTGHVNYVITVTAGDATLEANIADGSFGDFTAGTGNSGNGGQTPTSGGSARSLLTPAPTGATYNAGDEVTLGNTAQKFFVLSDDGTNVKLLAKYCLSKEASAQLDNTAEFSTYGRRFSNTNYWSGQTIPTHSQSNLPVLELQTSKMLALMGDGETAEVNAIKKAQEYGETMATAIGKTVTGRLMTYQEAYDIQNGSDSEMKNILWGNWTVASDKPTENCLYWWLGAADAADSVWYVRGRRQRRARRLL